MPYWYDSVETHMSQDGVLTIINCGDKTRARLAKDAATKEWLDRADEKGEWPQIVTRAHVETMLKGVDEKLILDAKLAPETTDTAAPSTGSVEAKEAAQRVKLEAVLPVAEWLKCVALAATVEAKPVEPVDERK